MFRPLVIARRCVLSRLILAGAPMPFRMVAWLGKLKRTVALIRTAVVDAALHAP